MNLANRITMFRIILIPVFMAFAIMKIRCGMFIAASVFLIAVLSDILDGYVARRTKQDTPFGKFLDPLADKLLVSAALLILLENGSVSSIAAMIIISREFIITALRTIAAARGIIIAAGPWGKAKTVMQDIAILSLLVNNYPFSLYNLPFARVTFYIALALTIASGIDYIYKNRYLFADTEEKE